MKKEPKIISAQPTISIAAQAIASEIARVDNSRGAWSCVVAGTTIELIVVIPARGRSTLTISQVDDAPSQADLNLAAPAFGMAGHLEAWSRAHTRDDAGNLRRTATAIIY